MDLSTSITSGPRWPIAIPSFRSGTTKTTQRKIPWALAEISCSKSPEMVEYVGYSYGSRPHRKVSVAKVLISSELKSSILSLFQSLRPKEASHSGK